MGKVNKNWRKICYHDAGVIILDLKILSKQEELTLEFYARCKEIINSMIWAYPTKEKYQNFMNHPKSKHLLVLIMNDTI